MLENLKRIRRWYQDLVLLIQIYFNPYKVSIIQFAGLNLFFSPKPGTTVNLSKFIYHWNDFEIVTVTIFHTNEKFQLKISWVTAQWHPNWSGATIISTMRILDLSTLRLSGSNWPMLTPPPPISPKDATSTPIIFRREPTLLVSDFQFTHVHVQLSVALVQCTVCCSCLSWRRVALSLDNKTDLSELCCVNICTSLRRKHANTLVAVDSWRWPLFAFHWSIKSDWVLTVGLRYLIAAESLVHVSGSLRVWMTEKHVWLI